MISNSTALRGVSKLNRSNSSMVSNKLELLREEMYRSFFSDHREKDEYTYLLSQRIDQLVLEIMKSRQGS